jgi:flavin reductase (DIM6/NTAB) family NADH-FMN oxidoreductase RutF
MKRIEISPQEFNLNVFTAWSDDWFLLTCGENEPQKFNCMTVGWGSLGIMWGRPFVQVVVRPVRHTHVFAEKYNTFTLCAFPAEYRGALNVCGTKSGRDTDKIKAAGFTPIPSIKVAAPGYDEAELIIECRKMYRDVFRPAQFLDNSIDANYKNKDYHTVYFGEILRISGVHKYSRKK